MIIISAIMFMYCYCYSVGRRQTTSRSVDFVSKALELKEFIKRQNQKNQSVWRLRETHGAYSMRGSNPLGEMLWMQRCANV